MRNNVRIPAKKAVPIWLLVFALVAAGAGAAAGTVLAGKVTGETNVAVSQALLVEAPTWATSIVAGTNTPQQVARHIGWVRSSSTYRNFGAAKDDNTAFQAAAELAIGDWVAFKLPFKNASSNNLTALMTLNVPEGLEVEAYTQSGVTNISQIVRIGLNTWKFNVLSGAEYNDADILTIVVSTDDDMAPGYYTIDGTIKQIGY